MTNSTATALFQESTKNIYALTRIYAQAKNNNLHNYPCFALATFSTLCAERVEIPDYPESTWIYRVIQALQDHRKFRELFDKVQHSNVIKAIATVRIADIIGNYIDFGVNSNPSEIRDYLTYAQDNNLDDTIIQLEQELSDSENAWQTYGEQLNAKALVDIAVNHCLDAIEGALAASKGCRDLPGFPNSQKLAIQVNATLCFSDRKIAKIMRYLGRLEGACGGRKIKTKDKPVSGIAFGNDVANLLPEEWLKSDMQFDLEFAESKLSQYYKGVTSTKAGDIIVLLDESASMEGFLRSPDGESVSREVLGKAILLLLWRIAQAQKRGLYVITFDTRVRAEFDWRKTSADQVGEFLASSANGDNTNFERPLTAATDIVLGKKNAMGRYKKADIVMITDAEEGFLGSSLVSVDYVRKFNAIKQKTQLQVHGILVGDSTAEKVLKRVADKVIKIPDLSKKGEVGQVLFDI